MSVFVLVNVGVSGRGKFDLHRGVLIDGPREGCDGLMVKGCNDLGGDDCSVVQEMDSVDLGLEPRDAVGGRGCNREAG